MRYKNAKDVLPPKLLEEIQKYLCAELLYIPRKEDMRLSWGQLSGTKEQVYIRNNQITFNYNNGQTINELADEFCLSEASIRKIVYSKK